MIYLRGDAEKSSGDQRRNCKSEQDETYGEEKEMVSMLWIMWSKEKTRQSWRQTKEKRAFWMISHP